MSAAHTALVATLEAIRDDVESIAAEDGRCDEYVDGQDEPCGRVATYYEKSFDSIDSVPRRFGLVNVCCDRPECVRRHAEEIAKAISKGSRRGHQAPIEIDHSSKMARAALAKLNVLLNELGPA